jgi:hypothetical protein
MQRTWTFFQGPAWPLQSLRKAPIGTATGTKPRAEPAFTKQGFTGDETTNERASCLY